MKIDTLRGNVDTRLRKLDEGQYDAIVLAAAGLRRLGWQDRIAELIPVDVMCPAVGQGALAIETRDDGGMAQLAARSLDHLTTRRAVTEERELLAVLGGGCQVPLAHTPPWKTPGSILGPSWHRPMVRVWFEAPAGARVL